MIVELHDSFQSPARLKATRLLVTADDGTPLLFILEVTGGPRPEFRTFRAGDKDFTDQLRYHGFDKTVLVTKLDARDLQLVQPFSVG